MSGAIVARIEIDYVTPILLARKPLTVETWVSRIGRSSFDLDYRILQRDVVAARGHSVMVGYDYETAATRVLDDNDRELLGRYLVETAAEPVEA
jgi:acyl-CoA thioester hydrolase